jgi:cytochrome P450
MGGASANFDTEIADHDRMRRLLLPAFSAKRMRLLDEKIVGLSKQLIDDMVRGAEPGGPADLHAALSVPLPIYVICELLGVPFADREHFKGLSERAATLTGDDPRVALAALYSYTAGLAELKRREPGEDVITDLVAAQRTDHGLDDAELARIAAALLFAGHETTVNRISVGVLMLLRNPEALAALVTDPALVAPTVEEILRLAAPGDFGIARYAREDIVVGEGAHRVTIAAGDAVLLNTAAGNRDEQAFPDPEAFDPGRSPNQHLSFGHGGRFCIGASLARTELRAVFATLFTTLPRLRLAVDVSELRLHTERLTGGLYDLPVAW